MASEGQKELPVRPAGDAKMEAKSDSLPEIFIERNKLFEELWQEACEGTSSKWSCSARLLAWEELTWDFKDVDNWMPEGDSPLNFVMTRLYKRCSPS